jgi:hypothetical protein
MSSLIIIRSSLEVLPRIFISVVDFELVLGL